MTVAATLLTPLGPLVLTGSEAGLHAVTFLNEMATATATAAVPACLRPACQQLQAYFGRELRVFDLNYAPEAGTNFQRQVWRALAGITYGRTASYLNIARALNNPKSVRAVGAANGQNPLAIVWPCHRVIGADGSLTGYAGGMHRKKWLLEFEQPMRQGELFS